VLATFLQRHVVDRPLSFVIAVGAYLGTFLVVTVYPCFALAFGGHRDRVTRRLAGLLWLLPAGLLVLMVTNVDGGTLWEFTLEGRAGITASGPAFWGYVAYAYTRNLVGTVLLSRTAVRSSRPYQSQVAAIVFAVFAPWLANVLSCSAPLRWT
jgi:ABC-type dipeptide/oligopeptide/nickel transport system permease subunit